jgi:hypothetical protein
MCIFLNFGSIIVHKMVSCQGFRKQKKAKNFGVVESLKALEP